MGLQRF